jgi:hypothetical protein
MNIRSHSDVVAAVIAPPIGPVRDFGVIDVGASGGIAGQWRLFGDALVAVGFDPLVNNMKKMTAAERHPRVTYEAAFVGCHGFDELYPPEQREPRVDAYERASSVRAQQLMHVDFIHDHFNEGEAVVWSDRHITLDDRFSSGDPLDFLKIDTDGSDIQVLLGTERLLQEGAFLGVMIEAQFQGLPHEYANTFANIDRFLRAHGFQLYDLDRNRYTRFVLPGLFEYDITAQTLTGQALWGDALYFRDLAHPQYQEMWKYVVSRERVLKLVALFDLHGLPDCAAELLLAHPGLTTEAERTQLLDLLVKSAGFDTTYAEHTKRFEQQTTSFFPSAYRAGAPAPAPAPAQASTPPAVPSAGMPQSSGFRARARSLKRLLGV